MKIVKGKYWKYKIKWMPKRFCVSIDRYYNEIWQERFIIHKDDIPEIIKALKEFEDE